MRRSKGSVLVALAIAGTISAVAYPVIYSYPNRNATAAAAAALTGDTVTTQWGPLTPADRDLIVRVRLAGLWELPAGQQALERASSQTVKEAADHLIVGHADLDKRVRIIAAKLGVELPNQPTAEQQGWLDQMTAAKTEADYNKTWANLLRAAHGKIFPAIATVRNTTRNTLVRQLASDANQTVLDHITILEGTGEVDFETIANNSVGGTASPTGPPPPEPGQVPPVAPAAEPSTNPDVKSKPSPTTPGLVPTGRPDPEELNGEQGEPQIQQ